MKKNAFTLIELIAIVTILAVITLFSLPSIINMTKNNKEKVYQEFLQSIYIAVENYIDLNEKEYPQLHIDKKPAMATIQVKELIEEKLIKRDLINPKTEQVIKESSTIKIKKNYDNTFNYSFYEEDITINAYPRQDLKLFFDGYTMPINNQWSDITGNYKAVLTGFDNASGWTNNYIKLDGINDYMTITDLNLSTLGSQGLTIISVYKIHNSVDGNTYGIITTDDQTNGKLFFGYGSKASTNIPEKNAFAMSFSTPNTWITKEPFALQKIYDIAAVYKLTSANANALYIDGKLANTNSTASTKLSSSTVRIGKTPVYSNISLYSVMIYDRALSQEEIEKINDINLMRYINE